ncbi:MAG: hypothetical protein SZ59_C0003G0076 [candidate division TM6 bacterium GW2011_GWF2_28_16]|nr:MAG: hypothetical protein SZ59_C0003G0076 [candidate division TM6 bacterium GW2011_GWF2_28_16]
MNNKSSIKKTSYLHKPFGEIFNEIAVLLKYLKNSSDFDKRCLNNLICHTTIRMLEGIVNIIIESTKLNDKLKKNLDKLSLIDKFDLLLFLKSEEKLNLGYHLVGGVIELIIYRNNSIHPKVIETEIEFYEESGCVYFKPKKSWSSNEKELAIKFLKNAFKFLDYYLIDLCKCDIDFLSTLLLDTVKYSDTEYGILQLKQLSESKKFIELELKINIEFLLFLDRPLIKECLNLKI